MNDQNAKVKTLYISNLNYKISEEDLLGILGKYGRVQSVKLMMKPGGVHKTGIAFAVMNNHNAAKKAAAALHETIVDGRTIKVLVAREDRALPRREKAPDEKKEEKAPKPKVKRKRTSQFQDFLKKKK